MFELEGIDRKNLDIAKFTNKFLETKTTADLSVDANANVDDTSILSWNYEFPKPLMKLNSLYHIWKDALKKHGIKRANKMIELEIAGGIRIHDLHGWLMPYCWATSLAPIVNEGMPWVNNIKVKPVKHFLSLINNSIKYIYGLSTQCVGAIAVPDFLAYAEYFIRKDYGEEWFQNENSINMVKQLFQHWIYSVNDKARGNQSLTFNEKIIVDGKPISIGKFVESFLINNEMEKPILDTHYTFTLNRITGKLEVNRIKGVIKHKTKNKIVEYILSNGAKIKATDNHSFFTRTGLKIEEIQRNSNPTNLLIPFNFIKEDETESYLFDKNIYLNEKWMYLLGQYLGNGYCNEDNLYLITKNEKLNEYLINLFPEYRYSIESDKSIKFYLESNIINIIKFIFNDKILPRDFANKKHILHLIGGFIDATGTISKNNNFVLTHINKDLLESIQYILLGYGILSIIKKTKNKCNLENSSIYQLAIINLKDTKFLESFTKIQKLNIEIKKFTDKSNLYVDFKNILKDLEINLNDYKTILKKNIIKNDICGINDIKAIIKQLKENKEISKAEKLEKFLYALPIKIKKIKECKHEKYVYDISVENNENFLTSSNIYAHNSPFTNVSVFDKYWREAMFSNHTNPDYSLCNLENLKRVQRLFVEVLIEQQKDNPFTFPVMTACQLKDKETGEILDKDWLEWVSRISVENKLMNFYTSDTCDSLSSCCRLRNGLAKAKASAQNQEYTNSFGVGGLNIGSHRVVAINLPQIAYIAKYSEKDDWKAFYNILESRIKIAQDILDIHRELLTKLINNGNLPMYKYGCMDLRKQYSTLGFIGLYECLEIMGLNITTDEGINTGKKIINLFNSMNDARTKIDGYIRNVEQIPGESAAVTFCLKDKLQFANVEYDLYANQYIPLTKEALMTDRIKIQGQFDSDVSGGSILHIDIDQQLTQQQISDVIQLCAKNNVIYFALDDCLWQCKSCGKTGVGRIQKSPCHSAEVIHWMRVVGFRTPVKSWNKVRRGIDFPRRYLYSDMPA